MRKRSTVKVAIIDSGINPYHSHIGKVAGGISINVNKEMYLEYREDYRDRLGHGTAVAAATRSECPDCDLYSVRIFNDKLVTYPTVLTAAVEWAIEQNMDIINLSLGTSIEHVELRDLCMTAYRKGIFVIAAMDVKRNMAYPALYPGVYGVTAGELKPGQFLYQGERQFSACGFPRELNGDVQKYNLHGHSFASARMSGIIAQHLLRSPPDWTREQIIYSMLNQNQYDFNS